jgi:hypothetical protein
MAFLGLRMTHTPGAKKSARRQELQRNGAGRQLVAGEALMLGNRYPSAQPLVRRELLIARQRWRNENVFHN